MPGRKTNSTATTCRHLNYLSLTDYHHLLLFWSRLLWPVCIAQTSSLAVPAYSCFCALACAVPCLDCAPQDFAWPSKLLEFGFHLLWGSPWFSSVEQHLLYRRTLYFYFPSCPWLIYYCFVLTGTEISVDCRLWLYICLVFLMCRAMLSNPPLNEMNELALDHTAEENMLSDEDLCCKRIFHTFHLQKLQMCYFTV